MYAIRAVEGTPNQIEGYAVAFTSPAERDAFQQYFSERTDLGLNLFPSSHRPLDYRHNKGEVIGMVGQVVHMEVDGQGLFARSELNMAHPAFPFIRDQAAKGELGYSGETLPNWMAWDADGHVTSFPIFAMAISPNPSAPNGKTKVSFMRDLGMEVEGDPEAELTTQIRSIWDFPGTVEAPAPAGNPRVTYNPVNIPPTRALPGTPNLRGEVDRPPVPAPNHLNITEMTSEVDRVPLGVAMSWYHSARAMSSRRGSSLQLPENFLNGLYQRFMRSLIEDSKLPTHQQTYTPSRVLGKDDAGRVVRAPSAVEFFMRDLPEEIQRKVGDQPLYLRAGELMNTAVGGAGADWVYTGWKTEVWRNIRLASQVFGLFPSFMMPSNPFKYPRIADPVYAKRVSATTDQAQLTLGTTPYPVDQYITSNTTFNILDKFGRILFWQDEYEKWSQIDLYKEQYEHMVQMMTRTADYLVLHGDESDLETNISWYKVGGALPSTTDYDFILLMNGLRKYALNNVALNVDFAAAFSFANFITLRRKLGTLGVRIEDLVIITDANTYYDMLSTVEVKTLEVYGDQAVILSGELGRYQGIPIIVSEEMPLVDGSGRIDQDGAGTDSGMLVVNRRAVEIGQGWDIELIGFDIPYSDAKYMKSRASFDMQVMQNTAVAYGYDFTP